MSSKWGSSPTGSLVSASTTAACALEIVLKVAICRSKNPVGLPKVSSPTLLGSTLWNFARVCTAFFHLGKGRLVSNVEALAGGDCWSPNRVTYSAFLSSPLTPGIAGSVKCRPSRNSMM